MILGDINARETFDFLLRNTAWTTAFDWVRAQGDKAPPGIQQIQGDDIYVNVHGYATLPEQDCTFESHRKYFDLQYCIAGGELIDWQDARLLEPAGDYAEPKDLLFYRSAPALTKLHMTPGRFAIFGPIDAHRPKVSDGIHPSVSKLVVKVAARLLQ